LEAATLGDYTSFSVRCQALQLLLETWSFIGTPFLMPHRTCTSQRSRMSAWHGERPSIPRTRDGVRSRRVWSASRPAMSAPTASSLDARLGSTEQWTHEDLSLT